MTTTLDITLDEHFTRHSHPERCELGHLHYDQEEIKSCGCSESTGRTSSLSDMDVSTHDFWNMTLDDLDDLDQLERLPRSGNMRSSMTALPDECSRPSVATRRNSDGVLLNHSFRKKAKGLPPRNVSFGSVEIRVCERVLGDNPACHDGPSLSIGWKYDTKKSVDVEAFETKRQKERRSHDKLCLSPEKREKIAKRSGYTKKDIEENVKLVAKYQRRRERTLKEMEANSLAEVLAPFPSSQRASLAKFLQKHSSSHTKSSTSRSSGSGHSNPRNALRSL